MATKYDPTTADPGQIEKIPAEESSSTPTSAKTSATTRPSCQHPVGYRDGDQVHITVGQRRISAALEIGWPVIPIVIKPRRAAEADRAEELRLLEQIAPCVRCDRPRRPRRTPRDEHPGTVVAAADGLCGTCYGADWKRGERQRRPPGKVRETRACARCGVVQSTGGNTKSICRDCRDVLSKTERKAWT